MGVGHMKGPCVFKHSHLFSDLCDDITVIDAHTADAWSTGISASGSAVVIHEGVLFHAEYPSAAVVEVSTWHVCTYVSVIMQHGLVLPR